MDVTLVVPAYNEAKRILPCLEKLGLFIQQRSTHKFQGIVIVEKSSDGTLTIAQQWVKTHLGIRVRVIDNQVHHGKGFAVKSGMLQAEGDVVFFMDVDLSTPLDHISLFLEEMERDPTVDILIGDRTHTQTVLVKRQNMIRQTMGRAFNLLVRVLLGSEIRDTQCGFKAFRKGVIRPIFERATIDGFSFDVEILLLAKKLGFKVRAMPVNWKNDAESKVNIIGDSLRMFYELVKLKLKTRTAKVSPGGI